MRTHFVAALSLNRGKKTEVLSHLHEPEIVDMEGNRKTSGHEHASSLLHNATRSEESKTVMPTVSRRKATATVTPSMNSTPLLGLCLMSADSPMTPNDHGDAVYPSTALMKENQPSTGSTFVGTQPMGPYIASAARYSERNLRMLGSYVPIAPERMEEQPGTSQRPHNLSFVPFPYAHDPVLEVQRHITAVKQNDVFSQFNPANCSPFTPTSTTGPVSTCPLFSGLPPHNGPTPERYLEQAALKLEENMKEPTNSAQSPKERILAVGKKFGVEAQKLLLQWVTVGPVELSYLYVPSPAVEQSLNGNYDSLDEIIEKDITSFLGKMKSYEGNVRDERRKALAEAGLISKAEAKLLKNRISSSISANRRAFERYAQSAAIQRLVAHIQQKDRNLVDLRRSNVENYMQLAVCLSEQENRHAEAISQMKEVFQERERKLKEYYCCAIRRYSDPDQFSIQSQSAGTFHPS